MPCLNRCVSRVIHFCHGGSDGRSIARPLPPWSIDWLVTVVYEGGSLLAQRPGVTSRSCLAGRGFSAMR
jgi:hypothetical protein